MVRRRRHAVRSADRHGALRRHQPRLRCGETRQFDAHRRSPTRSRIVPSHLRAICLGLLHPDPARRLTGREVLRQLDRDATTTLTIDSFRTGDIPFVGRARELATLRAGVSTRSPAETLQRCRVSGPSGIGKSALLRRFLEQLAARPGCGRALRALLRTRVGALQGPRRRRRQSQPLPGIPFRRRSRSVSCRPMSRRCRVSFRCCGRSTRCARRRHARSRPSRSLICCASEDLPRCATSWPSWRTSTPVVIAIDDVQWADLDSTALLEEILRPPACARDPHPRLLSERRDLQSRCSSSCSARRLRQRWSALSLEPMGEDDAQALIEAWAPGESISEDSARQDRPGGERQSVLPRAAHAIPIPVRRSSG